MNFLGYLLPVASFALQATLAVLLLRGPYRRYPFLLVYACAQLIAVAVDGIALSVGGVHSFLYSYVYWTGDVIHDLLLFLLVITLTYRALEGSPLRPGVGRMLGIIAVAAAVLPFVLYHPYFTGRWFRHTSQLLSLGAAAMNLFLWTAILGQKKNRDHQLLMVSVGLGIAVTGLAVSYGIIQFMKSDAIRWLPDLFKALTQVAGDGVWCWAFLPSFARSQAASANSIAPQAKAPVHSH